MMFRLGMTEGVPIESKLISKRIENAQKAVEAQNFEARKHLLEYDDVMNKQRETIYNLRRSFLEGRDQKEFVLERADAIANELVETYCPREQHPDQWNVTQFSNEILNQFGFDPKAVGMDFATLNHETVGEVLIEKVRARYEEKETLFGAQTLRWLERHILLDVVDGQWKDHLLTLDHLKEGIGLRGYGQKDPLVEFKKEAFILFDELMNRIDTEAVRFLFLVRPAEQPAAAAAQPAAAVRAEAAGAARPIAIFAGRNRTQTAPPGTANAVSDRQHAASKLPSPPAPAPKSAATIPALAAPGRNTRSATAKRPRHHSFAHWNFSCDVCVSSSELGPICSGGWNMRIRRRTFPVLLTLVLSLAATMTARPALASDDGHFDRTLAVTGAVDLDVQTGSGEITVRTGIPAS